MQGYWDYARHFGSMDLYFVDSIHDPDYRLGKNLAEYAGIIDMVKNFTTLDPDALYVVLTSDDVHMDGQCNTFCGWHTYDPAQAITYAYIGGSANSDCLAGQWSACSYYELGADTPNGDWGFDSMVSSGSALHLHLLTRRL